VYTKDEEDASKILFRYVGHTAFLAEGVVDLKKEALDMMKRYAHSFDGESFGLELEFEEDKDGVHGGPHAAPAAGAVASMEGRGGWALPSKIFSAEGKEGWREGLCAIGRMHQVVPDFEKMRELVGMGFEEEPTKVALSLGSNRVDAALLWLERIKRLFPVRSDSSSSSSSSSNGGGGDKSLVSSSMATGGGREGGREAEWAAGGVKSASSEGGVGGGGLFQTVLPWFVGGREGKKAGKGPLPMSQPVDAGGLPPHALHKNVDYQPGEGGGGGTLTSSSSSATSLGLSTSGSLPAVRPLSLARSSSSSISSVPTSQPQPGLCAVCESVDPLQTSQLFVCLGCRSSYHTSCVKARPIPHQRHETAKWHEYVTKHFTNWRCTGCLARAAAAQEEELRRKGKEEGEGAKGGGVASVSDASTSRGAGGGKAADNTNFAYVGTARQVGREGGKEGRREGGRDGDWTGVCFSIPSLPHFLPPSRLA